MNKKTQLWLGILVGGAVAYYLYDHHKKTGKWLNGDGNSMEVTKIPAMDLYKGGWTIDQLRTIYTDDELIAAGVIKGVPDSVPANPSDDIETPKKKKQSIHVNEFIKKNKKKCNPLYDKNCK